MFAFLRRSAWPPGGPRVMTRLRERWSREKTSDCSFTSFFRTAHAQRRLLRPESAQGFRLHADSSLHAAAPGWWGLYNGHYQKLEMAPRRCGELLKAIRAHPRWATFRNSGGRPPGFNANSIRCGRGPLGAFSARPPCAASPCASDRRCAALIRFVSYRSLNQPGLFGLDFSRRCALVTRAYGLNGVRC
jgi:hypothetical protein